MTRAPEIEERDRQSMLDEAALSPQLSRLILEQLPARFWTTDRELRVTSLRGAGTCRADPIGTDRIGNSACPAIETGMCGDVCVEAHRRAAAGERAEYLLEECGRAFRCVVEPMLDAGGEPAGCIGVALDVTELHRALRAHAESEERFRTLAESINDAFWVLDIRDGGERGLTYLSPMAETLWGEPVHEYDEFYRRWSASVHRDDREGMEHALGAGLRSGVTEYEYRITRPDGQIRWLNERAYPSHDATGRLVRVSGITQDVTDKKQTQRNFERFVEETASASGDDLIEAIARHLGEVFNARWVCISEVDPEDPSHACSRLFLADGTKGEPFRFPLVGTPCGSVVIEGQRYIDSGLADLYPDTTLLRALGADSYLGTPMLEENGRRFGTVCLISDAPITRSPDLLSLLELCAARAGTEIIRERSEQDSRRSERTFRSILDNMRSLTGLFEIDGSMVEFNRRALTVGGVPQDELVGHPLREGPWFRHSEAVRGQIDAMLASARRGERARADLEIVDAHDEVMIVDAALFPIFDERVGRSRILGTAIDITDRIEHERSRLAAEARLFQAQRTESLGLLAGGIAHDFSNLLMAIQGHLELARRELESDHPARVPLSRVEEASRQAVDVTGSLLSFTQGKPAQKAVVEVGDVVDRTSRMLRRTLPASIELRVVAGSPGGAWTYADESQLHQVVMNLAINARDAMPEGGLLEISVSADQPEGEIVLVTKDSGCGMDEETRARACDPYFTTKTRSMGTGLGLAMSHAIVREHGGLLEIESSPGMGSTVRVRLPAHDPGLRPVVSASVEPQARGDGGGALLCEDNPQVRMVLTSMLQELGYKVRAAESGLDAVEIGAAQAQELNLLVLDVDLPGLAGTEALARLRARGVRAPAVVISGAPIVDPARLGEGCVVLRKPFMLRELDEAIIAATEALLGAQ